MTKFRIAFATNDQYPQFTPDDRLCVAELAKIGIETVPAIWSEPRDWSEFNAVVIRSTWKYWLKYEEFLKWLDTLEQTGVRVWNPVQMLRWNLNKTYLRELSSLGVPIVPTEWVQPNDWGKLKELSENASWAGSNDGQPISEWIAKPVISGDSFLTYRLQTSELASSPEKFKEIWKLGPAMVQPFLKSVIDEGEFSFLFFGGEFSHALIKNTASGDFRVQSNFGGTSRGVQVEQSSIDSAAGVLLALENKFKDTPLYARVDMLRNRGALQLVELEVLEPSLYLKDHPGAPALFAEKIRSYLLK